MALANLMVLGNIYRTVGFVLAAVAIVGFVVYVIVNVVAAGRPEVGSELELAPNRKPYLDDEELEGPKLDRVLTWGLLSLFVFAIGLPIYWVMEPGRQENAANGFNNTFVKQGEEMFAATGENLQALNCAGCHGGMKAEGGTAPYNLELPDGSLEQVQWKAPALNTVLLRYSREEVTYILTYGRPYSPMPAWGLEGGGPLNEQQVQNLIDYLETIQLTPEEAQANAEEALRKQLDIGEDDEIDWTDPAVGEALFNLGIADGTAGGAYACARCHTPGWSYASSLDEIDAPAAGALGPSLRGNAPEERFPSDLTAMPEGSTITDAEEACANHERFTPPPPEDEEGDADAGNAPAAGDQTEPGSEEAAPALPDVSPCQDHVDFVTEGSVDGQRYGENGQGTGRMPGWGLRPPEPALFWINKGQAREFPAEDLDGDGLPESTGMLTRQMIEAIVAYERSLD
jgi:mono/diheme cytochrome c family protein